MPKSSISILTGRMSVTYAYMSDVRSTVVYKALLSPRPSFVHQINAPRLIISIKHPVTAHLSLYLVWVIIRLRVMDKDVARQLITIEREAKGDAAGLSVSSWPRFVSSFSSA